MTMQWWRCKHGAPFDTKWRTIARRVNGKPGDVWAVASALFDAASQAEPRGDISKVDLEELADGFGYDIDYVTRIYLELKNKEVHDGQLVLNFEKHQTYEDTTAAERKRRQRDREKKEREARDSHAQSQQVTAGHDHVALERDAIVAGSADVVTVTVSHATSQEVTPPDTDSDQKRPEQIRPEEGSLRSPDARAPEAADGPKEVAPIPKPEAPRASAVAVPVTLAPAELPAFLRRLPDDLTKFLAAYPSTGEGHDETLKVWKSCDKTRPPIDDVLASVATYLERMASENLARPPDNQRQPCHASKWLREKRWERYAPMLERPKIEGDAVQRDRARRASWGGHPAVAKLCAEVGEGVFDTWFGVCRLSIIEGVPVLHAPSRLVRDTLWNKHMTRIEAALGEMVVLELDEAKVVVAA